MRTRKELEITSLFLHSSHVRHQNRATGSPPSSSHCTVRPVPSLFPSLPVCSLLGGVSIFSSLSSLYIFNCIPFRQVQIIPFRQVVQIISNNRGYLTLPPRPFHSPPAWFMCELVPSSLAGLFYFVSLCFYWWYVSPSLYLAACLLPCTGRLVVRASPSVYLCCIIFFHLAYCSV